jgi:hypothetical protein
LVIIIGRLLTKIDTSVPFFFGQLNEASQLIVDVLKNLQSGSEYAVSINAYKWSTGTVKD